MQTMEPTADQLRIASLFDKDGNDKDLENLIKQVQEFTGCNADQAAVALYDCDNDIQLACLKVMDSSGVAAKPVDKWTAVDKPQKKIAEKDNSFGNSMTMEKFERSPTDRGRGRGRGGYFDGGRGRGRGRSFAQGDTREQTFEYQDRGYRGRGRGRGRGERGGFRGGFRGDRGRSEPFRGGRAHQNVSRSRNRRGNSPSSEAGSDGGWGKEEEKITNWSNKEFTRDGWAEPDSSERFNHKQDPVTNDWSDSPKPIGKVEQWQNQNTPSWNDEDNWGAQFDSKDERQKEPTQHSVEATQWVAEPAPEPSHTWDNQDQIQQWSQPEPQQKAPPKIISHWNQPEPVRQSTIPPGDNQRQERLAKIFNQQVSIQDQPEAPKQQVPVQKLQKPHQPKQQNNMGPPGLQKQDPVLSFGRSPEDAGRRLPPPTRRHVKKGVLQMPDERDDSGKPSQFVFGNIDSSDDVEPQYSRMQQYSEKPSPPLKQTPVPGYAPQNLHTQRKPTATETKEQNKPDQQSQGLYTRYAREKAETDLRNLLKPNPQSSKPTPNLMNHGQAGVVPGLTVPNRTSPNNPPGQMGSSLSAPGQGRSGSIGNVRTNLGHQGYSQPPISVADNIMYQPASMNQGYDILQIQRPSISRQSDDGLRNQSMAGFQTFPAAIQPQQYYTPMQYYPMVQNHRSTSYAPQMYSTGQAGNSTADPMRTMRGQQQETPPPFLSPTAYQGGVFPNILIPPGPSGPLGPHGQHPDNRGPPR